MGGIVALHHRDGAPVERSALEPMLAALGHRGPDGSRSIVEHGIGLGYLRFWTTPEAVGERQPLVSDDRRLALAFDGRIDNREALWRALPAPKEPLAGLSDAALVLLAWYAWEAGCLGRVLGPFAIVVADRRRRRTVLARDPLGGRGLCYHLDHRRLVAASEEAGVAAYPALAPRLDPVRVASYFALGELVDGRTFLRGVRQLLPGEVLAVDGERVTRERFWRFDPTPRRRRRDPRDDAARVLSALTDSVRCRTRGQQPPAVMLSGGLDSAPIAALASRMVAPTSPLVTVSWVFDRYRGCDERVYIDALAAMHPLAPIHLPCDDAWPLSEPATWPVHPSTPEQNAYRRCHQRAYRAARRAGARVLLSGMCGDQLYAGTERWLADLIAARRYRAAAAAIARSLWPPAPPLRALVPHRLAERLRRLRPRRRPPWLTEHAFAVLPRAPAWPAEASRAARPTQCRRVLELMHGHGFNVETYYANRAGLELRYPFRDRRLVELMLRLPTAELFDGARRRPVMRRAMAGLLPPPLLARSDKTSFAPLFRHGLYGPAAPLVDRLLDRPGRGWPAFVRPRWLDRVRRAQPIDGAAPLVLWLCVCFELWLTARVGPSGLGDVQQLA